MSSLLVFNRVYTVSHAGIFDPSCELMPLYLLSSSTPPAPPPPPSLCEKVSLCIYSESYRVTGKFQNFKILDRFEEGGPPVNLLGADDRGGVAGGGGAEVHLAHPHGGGVQHVLRLVDKSLHSPENYYCESESGKKSFRIRAAPDPK
jgi:hypothetical protein